MLIVKREPTEFKKNRTNNTQLFSNHFVVKALQKMRKNAHSKKYLQGFPRKPGCFRNTKKNYSI